MIDIHTHILPGVDDGSKNIDESLSIIETQLNQGINRVVLTPHVNSVAQKISSKLFLEIFFNLEKIVKEKYPQMTLYLGAEVRYHQFKTTDYENFVFKGFNNKYILMEFSMNNKDPIVEVLYNLSRNGYIPILAHAERYLYLSLDDYQQIKKDGSIIQVNSGAILNLDGRALHKRSNLLIRNNLVDIIASDCHNLTTRQPNLMKALEKMPEGFTQKELI